jgi:hypothetical protein
MPEILKLFYGFYVEIFMFSLYDGRPRSAVEDGGESSQLHKATDNTRSTQSRLADKEGSSNFRSGTKRISPYK